MSQHLKNPTNAPQRQDPNQPKEGCSLLLGVPGRWVYSFPMLGRHQGLLVRGRKNILSPATSAILKHCTDHHHPLPSVSNFNIIDKNPSQVTQEVKEAIHIQRLDPSLNRNIGKMSIPTLL